MATVEVVCKIAGPGGLMPANVACDTNSHVLLPIVPKAGTIGSERLITAFTHFLILLHIQN